MCEGEKEISGAEAHVRGKQAGPQGSTTDQVSSLFIYLYLSILPTFVAFHRISPIESYTFASIYYLSDRLEITSVMSIARGSLNNSLLVTI